jgi:PAS domain S-box-containing protein
MLATLAALLCALSAPFFEEAERVTTLGFGVALLVAAVILLRLPEQVWVRFGGFIYLLVGALIGVLSAVNNTAQAARGVRFEPFLVLKVLSIAVGVLAPIETWAALVTLIGSQALALALYFTFSAQVRHSFPAPEPASTLGAGVVGVFLLLFMRREQKTEQQLALADAKARALASHILNLQDAYCLSDLSGTLHVVNPAAAELFGYASTDELLRGAVARDLYWDGNDREQFIARLLRDGTVKDVEMRGRRRDGTPIMIAANVRLVRDTSGKPESIETILRDVTRHSLILKETGAALEHTERKLSVHLHQTLLGVIEWRVLQEDGRDVLRVREWNPAAESMLGHTRAEALGKGYEEIFPGSGHMVDRVLKRLTDVPTLQVQAEARRRDGSTMLGEWFLTLMTDAEGRPEGILTLVQDLTSRREAEAAAAASRAKGMFLASMSHEIRTPMNAILGYAQVLERESALSPEHQRLLDGVRHNGEHLIELLSGVLELSRIETGQAALHKIDFDPRKLLDELDAMFGSRATSAGLGLTFSAAPAGSGPVRGDAVKVKAVLVNLIGNALKFTREGSVIVSIDMKPALLTAEVRDTGLGIAAEELERIFAPFEQGSEGRRRGGGTGLGLSISRELARAMGGDLVVDSRLGEGSTFRLQVPIERALGPAQERPGRIIKLAEGTPALTVLVVDDRDANRDVLCRLLRLVGFSVISAPDGVTALDKFAAQRPRLVMMDLGMPGMDGAAVTRQLRSADPTVRIIGVTASAFQHDWARLMDAGVDEVLPKPFKADDLFTLIGQVLKVQFQREIAPEHRQAHR